MAKCSMKRRMQATRASPGGRSFSNPIHERAQLSRSRQKAETSTAVVGSGMRFTLEVCLLKIARAMELITILNQCYHFPRFVYRYARFGPDKKSIEIAVRPPEGSAAICSGCQKPAPGYDHLPERRFEFIPLWGFLVFFLYRMRRVNCAAAA